MASSTVQIMMVLMGLVVPAAVLCSIAVVVLWTRQRVAVRRAGVSADSPGCSKCLYLVRGWNSPVCPECGTDVRAAGVVTGIRLPRWFKLLAALLLTAAVMIPVGNFLAQALFAFRTTIAIHHFQSPGAMGGERFDLDIRTLRTTWNLPQRTTTRAQITLAPSAPLGGINIHFRTDGWAPPVEANLGDSDSWITWTIDESSQMPSADEIKAWLAQHLGVEASQTLGLQAQQINATLTNANAGGPITPAATFQGLFRGRGSGTGSASGMAPGAGWVSIGLPALCLLLVGGHVWFRHRPGWRAARDGEWAELSQHSREAAQPLDESSVAAQPPSAHDMSCNRPPAASV
jgi:hypothetical protein